MAGFLGVRQVQGLSLEKEVNIEKASIELSEQQRQEVWVTADLDARAPFSRMLYFLEEVLLASASGEGLEESILVVARRLLGETWSF